MFNVCGNSYRWEYRERRDQHHKVSAYKRPQNRSQPWRPRWSKGNPRRDGKKGNPRLSGHRGTLTEAVKEQPSPRWSKSDPRRGGKNDPCQDGHLRRGGKKGTLAKAAKGEPFAVTTHAARYEVYHCLE